jgi:hypothetical protein
MATLRSDIIGRVNRLPLRPTERGALLPLMEAISNSVFSITERLGDRAKRDGQIVVHIVRDAEQDSNPVVGFDIEDNGEGFTDRNFESFLTPDSRYKEAKGGKGIGRLAWLKVFDHISVESSYFDGGAIKSRRFGFRLLEHDQVEELGPSSAKEVKTVISFRNFRQVFENRCPARSSTVASRIIAHFVPLFVAGNAPKIVLRDEGDTDIEGEFVSSILDQRTDTLEIELDGELVKMSLWSLKCSKSVKFDESGYNFSFLTGNSRSVVDYCLDDQLGLKALDDGCVYVGCLSSDYLDQHVNAERTAFTLDGGEIDAIKRSVARQAREYLSPYVEAAILQKVKTTQEVVAENPQFMFVIPGIKDFALHLQPNTFKKEDIFVELSRTRFRKQKSFDSLRTQISQPSQIDNVIQDKIAEYQKFVEDEKKGALAEYVIRRKAILDLFERFLSHKDAQADTYEKEDALHRLICPMRIDSRQIEIDSHNLWIIDDRLAFFHYFASDLEVNKYAAVETSERPDLAFFYDACVAWRQQESADTVVIVEFKRPMRTDYSRGRDPVQQVLTYVQRLKRERAIPDIRGRAIRGISESTAFHCYIVADITPELEERLIGRIQRTPDGEGYFGYQTNPTAFVEIVPYGKLLNDARLRNTIFFQHLGVTNTG